MAIEMYSEGANSMTWPLGMPRVPDEPCDTPTIIGPRGGKSRSRRNGIVLDLNNGKDRGETAGHEDASSELAIATAALVSQICEIHLPARRRKWDNYINALAAFMAGESGDTGRIAFLTGKSVEETRSELQALQRAGAIKVGVGSIRTNLVYSRVDHPRASQQ